MSRRAEAIQPEYSPGGKFGTLKQPVADNASAELARLLGALIAVPVAAAV